MKPLWHHVERFSKNLSLSSSGVYVFSATCLPPSQSQRDYVLQPRVARNELPWVGGPLNPERVPPKTLNRYSGGDGRGEEALSSRALSPLWPFSNPLLLVISLLAMLNFSGRAQNNASARQLI